MRSFKALRYGVAVLSLAVAAALAAAAGPASAMGPSSPPPGVKSSNYTDGMRAVQAKEYAKAVPLLERAITDDPNDADANNLLGYSHRKLGNQKAAFMYYQRALQIDPNNKGANEYLGELYVEMKDLPKAEVQLQKVTQICGGTGCEEYRDLKAAIDAAKSAGTGTAGPRTGT
jgi:Tfp pilus assembly protein PilF